MHKSIYKICFLNQGSFYEIYARQIHQSKFFGFIEVEEMIFGEKSNIVVDPTEERVRNEFNGVKRSYIPMHNILRIDEVVKEGPAKIKAFSEKNSNVTQLNPLLYSPKERN